MRPLASCRCEHVRSHIVRSSREAAAREGFAACMPIRMTIAYSAHPKNNPNTPRHIYTNMSAVQCSLPSAAAVDWSFFFTWQHCVYLSCCAAEHSLPRTLLASSNWDILSEKLPICNGTGVLSSCLWRDSCALASSSSAWSVRRLSATAARWYF